MKLKTITPSTKARGTKPRISFSKTGSIRFNSAAVDALGLIDGMQVLFHQDMDKPEDWYFSITDKDGFFVRKAKGKPYCVTNSKLTFERMAHELGTKSTFHCNIDTKTKDDLYAIATKTMVVSGK